ncbi:MAG: ATP-binding protein [Leptolyngbya sp. IPPAS B-1204]|nr:MAG: HAMP domain-containing protein [Leptolyngbya sp. IPPAS B-1204]
MPLNAPKLNAKLNALNHSVLRQKFRFPQPLPQLPLLAVLVVPFLLQIFTAVGLVGYFSFRNGQKAINDLANQLQREVSARVDQHLDSYLALPHQINQINLNAIKQGMLDLYDLDNSGRYFWKQAQIFKQFGFIGYALEDNTNSGAWRWPQGHNAAIIYHPGGSLKDYTYEADQDGNRKKLLHVTDFYAPAGNSYVEAVKAGKALWTRIYTLDEFEGYIAAAANVPIYDANQKLIGVLGIDLFLTEISAFLQQIQVSPTGRVFIMERDGMLIGNSSSQPTYRVENGKTHRLRATDSDDPLIRATASYLQQQFNGFQQIQSPQQLTFEFNQDRQFVEVSPWQDEYGIDWLVAVVVPESDFMAQINANTRTTITLCLVALAVATVLGIYTSRWIARTILRLGTASQAITAGNLNQQVQPSVIREVNSLAQSFNQMASQLQASFLALEQVNTELEDRVEARTAALTATLEELRRTQAQMVQSEKMSALGQMVAGVAHEINNPVNFIHGNVDHAQAYAEELLHLLQLYQHHYPKPVREIQTALDAADLEFIEQDFTQLLHSMQLGSQRISDIVQSLRSFSKLDEAGVKSIDLHEGIDTALLLLQHRLKPQPGRCKIQVIRDYQQLPLVECYPGQINQVFMNILNNAIDALEEAIYIESLIEPVIKIRTVASENEFVKIYISDNGIGINPAIVPRLFDPFFTTKPVGKGTGIGLSISYQIVTETHHGSLECNSEVGQGAEFVITIPTHYNTAREGSK